MLKKNNKILVGCLALLLVMAVGYALFSETITINGTATAKGEFSINVTCEKGLSQEVETTFTNVYSQLGADDSEIQAFLEFFKEENGFTNDYCTVNNNTVSYGASLSKPGAKRVFVIKVENTGTIDMHATTNNVVEGTTNVTGKVVTVDGVERDANVLTTGTIGNFVHLPEFLIYDGEGEMAENVSEIVLKPGEVAYYFAYVEVPIDINTRGYGNLKSMDIQATSNATLTYQQITN